MRVRRLGGLLGALAILWTAGGLVLFRDLGGRRATEDARAAATMARAVAEVRRALLAEARALAADPAVVAGARHGDWAVLTRAAAPRLGAVASERMADLLLVVDPAGDPLVQVPALPRVSTDGLAPPPAAPRVLVRRLGDRGWLLALAPVMAEGQPVGAVVVARAIDRLGPFGSGAVLVALVEDELVGVSDPTLAHLPWDRARAARTVVFAGEPWRLEPLPGTPGLWAGLAQGAHQRARRHLALWLGLSFLVAALGVALADPQASGRRRRAAGVAATTALSGVPASGGAPALQPGPPAASREEAGRRLEFLRRLTRALTAPLDLDALLQRVAEATLEVFGDGEARLWLLDEAREVLTLAAEAGARGPRSGTWRLRVGEGLVGAIAASRAPLAIADLPADPRLQNRERVRAEGLQSFAGVPVLREGRVLGALTLATRYRHAFTGAELAMLAALADHAAVAIDNARRFGEAVSQRAQLEALVAINARMGVAESPDALLRAIAEEAARLLGVDNAGFRLVEGDELVVAGLAGTAVETMGRPRIRIGESLSGRVVAEGRPLMVALQETPALIPEHRAADERLGYTHFLGVPVQVGERTVGTFAFRARRPFTAQDQALASAFATQAAVVLEQARLAREARRQAERMQALADVERLISATLDPDGVAQRIADSLLRLLGVRSAAVYRLEPESGDLVAMAAAGDVGPTFGRAVRFPRGTGAGGLAVREGRTVTSPDLLRDPAIALPPDVRARIEAAGYRAVLAVPLRVHDRIIGALGVGDRPGRRFDDEEIRLAEAFADQAALALDNARVHAEAEQRRREAEALAAFARRLTETLELPVVGERIVTGALPLFRAASVGLRLLQPDGSLVALAWAGADEPHALLDHVQPPGTGLAALALAEGRIVSAPDVLADPRVHFPDEFRERLAGLGHRAVLAVPLQARGRRVGVLLVVDRTAREFTPEEVALAQAFADQAALALDNARLHEEVEQRRREADVLAELARSIGSALDMDTVLRRVAEGARELCRADLARVALLDPAAAAMAFRQWVGSRFPHYDRVRVAPGQGLGGLAWRTGAAVRTENYLEDPRTTPEFCEIARAEGVVAELVVPIRVGERVEGLLYVDRRTPRPFTDRDEAVLRRLTEHAGVAIQNARLYQGLERHSARLRVLARVNAMVSSSLDTAEVLRGIARAASELMDGAFVLFWVADEQARTLHRGAVSDEAVAADFPLEQLPFGEGASGWVAAHRAPLTIPDVSADPRYRAGAWAARHGLTSYAGVPLVFQDTLLGVLTVSSQTPRAWTDDEADLLGAFAAQAAVALQHARLHAETRRRLEETQALLDVASLLNATLDSRELLKRVALKIAHVCGVDRCTIERWEGGRVIPLMSQFADGHHDPAMWAAFRAVTPYDPAAVPAHARALATRRPVVIADATTSAELPREWVETYGIKSYLVVPLVRQDRVIGVMNLDYCRAVTPFEPWQVRLAEAIGSQLALALENTRLYAEAQERLRETTTLLRVGQILSHPVPVAEALRRVAREVALALEADMVGAYTADAARQTLSPLAGYRVPAPLREWFRTHPLVLARMGRLAENWRAGRPTASPDAQGDPGLDREWARALPAFSTLVVPTRVRGESVGAFCVVWWRTGRDVTPAEVRLVEGVAAQVGLALENAELARQRELRLRETEVLLEATRAIASTLEPSRLLRQLMRQFLRITGADTVGMWTLDERGTWLTPWQGYRVPREWLPVLRGLRLAVADLPLYAQAIATGRAAWIADALAEPRLPATLTARTPHRGHLFVPVRAKDRPVGAFIAVWRTASREFTQRELELLESLGQQAGVALENAWLFEQNRRQVDELTVLHELSRAMTGQLDRGTLLDALRQQLPRVLSVDRVVVLLLDEATGELEVALRLREGAVNRDPPLRYPRGVGLAGVVLSTGRPLRTDDYAGECARLGVAQPGPDWPAVWLGVPLVAGGHVMGVLALMRDQRPFTEAEERLAMSIADLTALALRSAQLYEERTRAYQELQATQDQLVRTEKLRALGEMASGVAHDFNNLLAAILGRTQLLLRHVQEPRLRQWLQVVERSALDGAQTVRRLQDFARVRRDTPMIPVDLNAVVRDALEITQSRWREEALRRGVVIRVDARLGPVPPVAGDPAELREALTNLILNAVDAMPQGGTLRLTTTPAEGAAVEVAVSDTGVGIPAAIRDRIFDPFFTTKGPQGTGLGLSMTYGIVVRHGGHISVESEEGQGSTFRLRFPALTDPPPAAGPRGVAEEAVEAGLRCLVVDDEEEVGRALGDVLEALGHHAAVVTAGARALEYLTMEPVDVVFTDLAMPEVSGWQVARAIRERWPHIPVFLVTGFGVELSAEERQAHGVAAVYAKPLSLDDITEALARARQARKAPRPREEP